MFSLSFLKLCAQLPCDYPPNCQFSPFNGNIDLATPPAYYTVGYIQGIPYSKPNITPLFRDIAYELDNNTTDADWEAAACTAPPDDQCLFDLSALVYDIYYPADYPNYATCPLPVVVLFHASGFSDCFTLNEPEVLLLASELAKCGYVVFNAEYRRGRILDNRTGPNNLRYRTVQQQCAAWVGCQDGRGVVRSVIQRARENFHSQYYKIDTNNIFVGGFSAGAVMAMSIAWYTDTMMRQAAPVTRGSSTFAQALGGMDVDFYYGSPSIEYRSKIRGVASMWGGIAIPKAYNLNEYDFFPKDTLRPVIAFHGFHDPIFPYSDDNKDSSRQNVYFSPPPLAGQTNYNETNFCVLSGNLLRLDQTSNTTDLISGSAENMHKIAEHHGIPNELYTDCGMAHGLDKCVGTGCVFDSEFGTGATNRTQVNVYIAQRIATFFQAILNGIAGNLGRRIFTECENERVACQQNVNPFCQIETCPNP